MTTESRLGNFAVHLALIAFTGLALYPVLWVVRMALTPSQSFAMGLSPIPEQVSLDNFVALIYPHCSFFQNPFLRWVWRSLKCHC